MNTITLKKKPALLSPTFSPLAAQIDLVGQMEKDAAKIQAQIKKLNEQLKPFKKESEKLQKMVDDLELGDDDKEVALGDKFSIEIGPRGNKREIKDLAKAKAFLGDELFMKLASITLKNLDDYLNPIQREEVIKTDRTSRSIKIIERR